MNQEKKESGNKQSAKVVKLGFNISVTGDPDADFEIVLDDKANVKSTAVRSENQSSGFQLEDVPKPKVEWKGKKKCKIESGKMSETSGEHSSPSADANQASTSHGSTESSGSKELSLINDIKTTMEHFEKFSDHIREIPRFRIGPIASSTPFPDKESSKSESNLMYPERRPRRFSHLYDYSTRREHIRGKPLPSDLFLKPLPGADLYKRGMVRTYAHDPLMMYGSVDSLTRSGNKYSSSSWKSNMVDEKYESDGSAILKKTESNEGGEKSTSSAESVKDIKIYQNGGILIMQNFKDTFDVDDKRSISSFSAKLIENCNSLKEEINNSNYTAPKPAIINSSGESQSSGKMVQFDLIGTDYQKNKLNTNTSLTFKDDSPSKSAALDLSERESLLESQVCQDFLSMSTQENDSIVSNGPGMSPGASGKKLEWDSGADVGYLNLDLSKENLSTIERIVLRGLSNEGLEKNVVYEKKSEEPYYTASKVILERKPSEVIIEEIVEVRDAWEMDKKPEIDPITGSDKDVSTKTQSDDGKKDSKELQKKHVPNKTAKGVTGFKSSESEKPEPLKELFQHGKRNARKRIKSIGLSNKSVNVNTLFAEETANLEVVQTPKKIDSCLPSVVPPIHADVKPPRTPPRHRKPKKKSSNANAIGKPCNTSRESLPIAENNLNVAPTKMGLPKKSYRDLEAKPELSDSERSREIEEIVVDQSLTPKEKLPQLKKTADSVLENTERERKNQENLNRPLSASSTKTVLSSVEKKDSKETNTMKSQLVDQLIQTNEYKVESVGIQAFSSRKSSVCNTSSPRHRIESEMPTEKPTRNMANVSSKNIQAFGLNSSLPKALAHPKETHVLDTHNTKSTQFFGGPINSLPNYHSQFGVNPLESCRKMFKVLKTKKSHESAVIDRKEENKKNIMANDSAAKIITADTGAVHEDKENLEMVAESSAPARDGHDVKKNLTRKDRTNVMKEPAKSRTESEASVAKSRGESENSPTVSDSQSCKVLTSKHLKEHGDSIDRNLIQDMYFQSQLLQLERREMISKSTSMDFLKEDPVVAEKVTVACQYSTISKDSEEESKDGRVCGDDKGYGPKTPEQSDGCPEEVEDEQNGTSKGTNQDFGTGDSFPSSSQTANSWVHGVNNSRKNSASAVGRARSFEYLPGDIYECSGNLREKPSSENGENVTTDSSSDGSGGSAKESGLTGTDRGSSEGRKTLVLENTNEDSWDSGQLRSLEENLTQLNIVVTRLREKDDQIRRITRSVLVNLWRHNGSGDATGHLDTPETKINDRRDARFNEDVKKEKYVVKNSSDEEFSADRNAKKALERKEMKKTEKDVSIGCQTEAKSDKSSLEKYQNERKALENRLAADKESQIKWIEKEIYHLNILRGILEKQNSLVCRKKKSTSTEVSEESQNDKRQSKDVNVDDYPRPVTPVYGCTISLVENNLETNDSPSDNSNSVGRSQNGERSLKGLNNTKYGMAVSLNGNLRRVMLLPVGVQVSMNNIDSENGNCSKEDLSEQEKTKRPTQSRPTSRAQGSERTLIEPSKHLQSDATTQYPSVNKSYCGHPSTSVQVDLIPAVMKGCDHCKQKNCVCLSLSQSEKSEASTNRYSKGDRTLSERQGSLSRQGVDSTVPINHSVGQKTMSNISGTDTLNGESLAESSQGCCGKSNERSLNSTAMTYPDKGTACRCENCPRRNTRKSSNSREQSQSTSHCHHRKGVDESSKVVSSCQCSKAQTTKSSACHVIKIVGSTCCGPENGTCSCKRRNLKKTSQNQSSQTDDVLIENKELVTSAELVKPDKGPNVIWPLEGRTAVDRKHSVDEKYLCSPRASFDARQPQLAKIGLEEKCALQKRTPEDGVSVDMKTPVQTVLCDCQKKKEKEKQKTDDHPRHYFLKIEETEMDESSELMERRKSLEVITVTVPVKKAGKAKIYGNDFKQSSAPKQEINPSRIQGKGGCTCCKDCIGQKLINYSHNYQARCQKLPAEKPDSYRKKDRNCGKGVETESLDDMEPRTEEIDFNECYNLSSSSHEGYVRQKIDHKNAEACRGKEGASENPTGDCYSRDRMVNYSRETPSDYDSHKEYRPQRCHMESGHDKGKKGPMVDRYVAEEPFERTTGSRTFKAGNQYPDWNQYDCDYYNYDKREFKTKSELLREEQKTKKGHEPSLQEYLERNRPDFCNSAESRRRIISERAEERAKNHGNRMECLMNLVHQCNGKNERSKRTDGTKRIFTTPQMKEQTMKRYRQLPEVTEKVADQKKKEEYRTNKLMADIFAKKLQLEALKGHINLSNSVSVLSTI